MSKFKLYSHTFVVEAPTEMDDDSAYLLLERLNMFVKPLNQTVSEAVGNMDSRLSVKFMD